MVHVHAQRVASIMSRYSTSQSSVVLAALAGAPTFNTWAHYPSHDVVDQMHGTQFYYHAHWEGEREPVEHGHFHVFVRSRRGSGFHHVIGISMTQYGLPVSLFLTNQWVTGERWVSSSALTPLISRFECVSVGRLAPVAQWISSMVHIYRPEILALHAKRDAWRIARRSEGVSDSVLFSDERHSVIARKSICLAARLAKLQ